MPLPTRVGTWHRAGVTSYRVTLVFTFRTRERAQEFASSIDSWIAAMARIGIDGTKALATKVEDAIKGDRDG